MVDYDVKLHGGGLVCALRFDRAWFVTKILPKIPKIRTVRTRTRRGFLRGGNNDKIMLSV